MSRPLPDRSSSSSTRPGHNWRANLALLCSLLALVVALSPDAGAAAKRLLTGRDIRDGSLQSRDIANGANGVRGVDIANGAVSSAKLAAGSVGRAQLAADALGSQVLIYPPASCKPFVPDESAASITWTPEGIYTTTGILFCPLEGVPASARVSSVDVLMSDNEPGADVAIYLLRYDENLSAGRLGAEPVADGSTSGVGDQKVTLAPPADDPVRVGDGTAYYLQLEVGSQIKLLNIRVHYTLGGAAAAGAATQPAQVR